MSAPGNDFTSRLMSYAKSVLQPGETIVAIGRLHWIIYRWAILFFVTGVALVWLEHVYWPGHDRLIAISTVMFGVLFTTAFLYAWFIRWITEFAVTTKRVISSRIFISRNTEEMSMDKVETVDVDQSVLGRVLGYGTLRITGTGGTNNIEQGYLAAPFALRNAMIVK
jgi:uncharacterized membrane protein YdbT with pleckstrin-like domain